MLGKNKKTYIIWKKKRKKKKKTKKNIYNMKKKRKLSKTKELSGLLLLHNQSSWNLKWLIRLDYTLEAQKEEEWKRVDKVFEKMHHVH